MKTKFTSAITIMIAILMSIMTGCDCKHEKWNDANCTTPKTCAECGITEGKALGHKWKDATCTEAKTCSICGKTEGSSLGHDWAEADCQTAATCKRCAVTQNSLGAHTTDKGKCSVCGEYLLDNVFIPASLDFASYGTYGEETGTSLTNCIKSDEYQEGHLTYFDVTATPIDSMCIDNCDIEVELKYWDIKEDGSGALMNMYVSYYPTDDIDVHELANAISEEFQMRYNLDGTFDSETGIWTNNTGNLSALISVITSTNSVYLILNFNF